jgi:hypothetical protein
VSEGWHAQPAARQGRGAVTTAGSERSEKEKLLCLFLVGKKRRV